jgi:hypothetical protein
MLQNFTKNDKNFQSKFVVFPKLQRNETTEAPTTTTTMATSTIRTTTMQFPVTMYRAKPTINLPREVPFQSSQILRDVSYPFNRVERVTIMPQVFLQNDQTPESAADENGNGEGKKKKDRKNRKNKNKDRKNRRNKDKKQTTTTSTTTQVPQVDRKAFKRMNQNRRRKFNESSTPGIPISTTQKTYVINLSDKHFHMNGTSGSLRRLNRNVRSHSNDGENGKKRRKGRKRDQNKMQRDIVVPVMTTDLQSLNKNETEDKLDLNPKHCYSVSGMSKGQQKLCEQFTSIMPAVSRGARSAIQVS